MAKRLIFSFVFVGVFVVASVAYTRTISYAGSGPRGGTAKSKDGFDTPNGGKGDIIRGGLHGGLDDGVRDVLDCGRGK